MKLLDGRELAGYIKERQAKEIRRLKQSLGVSPALAILHETNDPAITTYMHLKRRYGQDIGADVGIYHSRSEDTLEQIYALNKNPNIHGIIAQLPLQTNSDTEAVLNAVTPTKDVDGLSKDSVWDPAAPTAILWLLAGHGIDLHGKKVAIVGQGRLVGRPLRRMLESSGIEPIVFDQSNQAQMKEVLPSVDVIITATGKTGLITPHMVRLGAVLVDAGTASEGGTIKGDVADSVYQLEHLTITPKKGGVGPLTVCALFDNLLRAAIGKSAV